MILRLRSFEEVSLFTIFSSVSFAANFFLHFCLKLVLNIWLHILVQNTNTNAGLARNRNGQVYMCGAFKPLKRDREFPVSISQKNNPYTCSAARNILKYHVIYLKQFHAMIYLLLNIGLYI
jgi:hypothetical protein